MDAESQYEHDLQVENRALKIERAHLKELITKLADWIEDEFEIETFGDSPGKKLLQRAREVTK